MDNFTKLADILEFLMLIGFGISWPINISKAWKARSAKGTSVIFYFFIVIGYVFGIVSKILKISAGMTVPLYVIIIYAVNTIMVTCGIIIYFRNKRIDKNQQC